MIAADDLLTEPAARRASLARNAAMALAANGWHVTPAARHSGGTADIAADRQWTRGRLTARVRLIIRCDARAEHLVFSAIEPATDRFSFYSFGDDDPRQRRRLAELFDDAALHAAAYPRGKALTEPARIDAPRIRTRVAAITDPVLDEAFESIDAVRSDLLQHDLDVVRDDMDIDHEVAMQSAIDASHRCELIYPIVITDAELWTLPDKQRHDWLRTERASVAGQERQWVDVMRVFAADALTKTINAAFRKRRFVPADAFSRS